MNSIQILDCTLRDGGYCNEWRFGFDNIQKIVYGLSEANIEIIECGFLTNRESYDPNRTKFATVEEAAKVIPSNKDGKIFVAMLNYGEYSIDELPPYDGSSIDGIRVAFHKKDLNGALELCDRIKNKGYLVFVQAMVSLCYSDDEFISLIYETNKLKPYAFYIVDSFGMMKGKDLIHLFYMVEYNLNKDIWIGFHSHNNMQLAYSNAQQLLRLQTNRNLIIDTTIYGMGRGAGNLNTELFVEYLNENEGKNYHIKPILTLIDEILNEFYQQNYWGYSLPNYISAVHNAHPNYAGYLDDKKTLTIEGMNDIFDMMEDEKKVSYNKEYIEALYLRYMDNEKVQNEHKAELKDRLSGKKIVLVAPGKSSVDERNQIKSFLTENTVLISVNHVYEEVEPDFIFLSNLRRFKELNKSLKAKCIVTSNITAEGVYYQTKYRDLLNGVESVSDNAGLMAICFFMSYDVEGIYLAGFDGYTHDVKENYGSCELAFVTRNDILDAINLGMSKVLKEYSSRATIKFLTRPKNIKL